jgi:hypothetical protein
MNLSWLGGDREVGQHDAAADEALHPLLKLTTGEKDATLAGQTLDANVGTETDDTPFVSAAWVWLS